MNSYSEKLDPVQNTAEMAKTRKYSYGELLETEEEKIYGRHDMSSDS